MSLSAFAQENEGIKEDSVVNRIIEIPDFGEIDRAHLEMVRYEKDTSAAAVVLFDDGYLGFDFDVNRFYLRYHTQIKILNPDGFEFADVSLPFEGKKGLKEVKAATYNLKDGKMVTQTITEDMMVTEEVVDKIRVLKIPFSDVVVGSVIEYSYVMYGDSPFQFLPWYFQSSIPVMVSTFKLSFPRSKDLKPRLYGYQDLFNYRIFFGLYRFTMLDVPAFKEEAYVKNIDDHYSKVAFEYVSSYASDWESLIDIILDLKGFGTRIEKLSGINKIFPKEKSWTVNTESLKEIHAYVAEHFEWNGRNGLMFSDKPKKVWEASRGSSADINLSLLLFLKKVGFDVEPVFLSTADHGIINSEFPTFRQFNNVVVKVSLPDKEMLLDATSKLRPYNILPDLCLNDSGLVVRQGEPEWVAMNMNKEVSIQSVAIDYEVDEFGEMSGSGSIQSPGSAGASIKEGLIDEDETELEEGLQKRFSKLELSNVKYSGIDDAYATLKRSFDFSAETFADIVGDRIFFTPMIIKELETNPFKSATRTLSIDFAMPINKRYFFTIKVPEGYEVEELPKAVSYVLPDQGGKYSYLLENTGSEIKMVVRFTINRLVFNPSEYGNIREMFNLILAKQEERIVLKKKATD